MAGVHYLIVGGYAVMVCTEPRYTKDLDLWIEPTESTRRNCLLHWLSLALLPRISVRTILPSRTYFSRSDWNLFASTS